MQSGVAQAVAPSPGINTQINFQGRLLSASGAVIADGNYNMEFKLYKNGDGLAATDNTCTITDCQSTTGTLLWTEDWINQASHGVKVKNGYFSVSLGSITSLSGVDLNQPVLWLSMNVAGSTNATSVTCTPFSSCTPDGEMVPMKRLASAVYAFNSNQLGGLTAAGFIQNVAPTGTAQNANFDVLNGSGSTSTATARLQQVASATAPVLILKGGATPGSGADLLQLQNSSGTLDRFDSSGNLYLASGTSIDANTSSGTLTIGGVGTVSNATTINVGNNSGTTAQTINVAASTAANTVNIANGAITSGTETINVGTGSSGSGSDTVTVGSLNGTSTTTINGGSGNINLTTNQSGAGLVVKSVTNNSTNLLRIQNAAGTSFLTADSTKDQITTQDLSIGNLTATASSAGRVFSDNFESDNFNLWNGGSTISGSSTQVVSYGSAHTGNYAASFSPSSGNDHVNQTIPSTSTPIYYRAYVYVVSATTALKLFGASDGSVYYEVQTATNGNLSFNNNGTATTVGLNMSFGTWHEVELDLSPGAGSGSATIYLDGVAGTTVGSQTINNLTQLLAGTHSTTQTGSFLVDDISVDGNVRPGDSASLLVGDGLHVDGSASFGGVALFQNNTNSTTALQVQNASGYNVLTVDTSSNSGQGQVVLGVASHNNGALTFSNSAGSATVTLATTASNINTYSLDLPVAAPTASGQCLQSSGSSPFAQLTFGSCSGSGSTLQGAYTASTGGTTPEILLDSTRNGLDVQDANTTIGSSQPLFAVRAAATATTLGTGLFTVGNTGNTSVRTSSNSTTAFLIQNSTPATLFDADTTNMRIGVNATYSAMSVPTQNAPTDNACCGTLSAGTYFYKVTALDAAGGETTAGTEKSATASVASDSIALSWSQVTGATAYKVYRSTTSGTEVYLTTTVGSLSSPNILFTDDGSYTPGSGSPPGSNTAYVATNVSNSSLQLSVGGNGSPTGQLYVSGTVPASALATTQTANGSSGVYLQGRYAYVINATAGSLQIYDVSTPSAPKLMGSMSGVGTPNQIVVQGKYAYIADNAGGRVYVVNISNPTTPSTTGSYLSVGAHFASLYVQGKYVYALDTVSAALDVLDVSNPASPAVATTVSVTSTPQAVYVQGRYAYVTESTTPTIYQIDISNPASASVVSSWSLGTARPSDIVGQGNYLYTLSTSGSLNIFALTGGSVGSLAITGATALYVQGRYAYIVNQTSNTMWIVDVSNPANPVQVGSGISTSSTPTGVYVQGRYAYVTAGTSTSGSLQVFDVGGSYVQQLETGGLETGTLSANGSASVSGDLGLQGGLTVEGTSLFTGSLTAQGGVQVGNNVTDATQINLQLDSYSTFAESGSGTGACSTTTNQGALYYNTSSNAVRSCVNGAWEDVVTTSGLGIILFGVVPDSGANPGDLASVTDTTNLTHGPCKVSVGANTSTVSWTACTAYSGGRKVIVTAGTAGTTNGTAGNFQHLCLTGSGNQPALSTSAAETSGFTGSLAFSVTSPVLCLADIKFASANSTITDIYDTRTYTTTTHEFATSITNGAALGHIVVMGTTTPGSVTPGTALQAAGIKGVVVATSGAASTTAINVIIAVAGPAAVKAITETGNAVGNTVQTTATRGYAGAFSAPTTTNVFSVLGLARTAWTGGTACAASKDACEGSVLVTVSPR